MSTMTDDTTEVTAEFTAAPGKVWELEQPETPEPGFTAYRFGEDYPDTDGLCWDVQIVADRVFVCVREDTHTEEDHRWHRRETHGYVRMHRDPSKTFTATRDTDREPEGDAR